MGLIASPEELEGYRKIFEFSSKLLSCYELGEVLETLVDFIIELTRADLGMLLSIENDEISVRVARLAGHRPLEHPKDYYSESVVRQATASQQALLVNDAFNDPELKKARSILELSIRSVVCVPMFDRGELMGLIYVCSQSLANLFTPSHLETLTVFASQSGLLMADALKRDALARSEARYRSVVQSSPSPIAIVHEGKIFFANAALMTLLKVSDPRAMNRRALAGFFNCSAEAETIVGALNRGEAFDHHESALRDLDGNLVYVELSAVPVGKDGAMQVVLHDMTQQKALLAERLRLDRLVAMGTLAAGVGHEINNPLAYTQANIDFALDEVKNILSLPGVEAALKGDASAAVLQADILASLSSAGEGARRIRDVIRGFQAFSRLDGGKLEPISLEQPLEFSIDMAMSRIRHRARLVRQIDPTPPVLADQSRLGQVFLNLLINAADAIEERDAANQAIMVRAFSRGSEVIVEIHDTGPGIAPEIRETLFEPFVTTKEAGKGTGLGLSICHSIVTDLGGRLEIESEPGHGACFRVILPAAGSQKRAQPTPHGTPISKMNTERRARVLIIDDEELLGRALARGLGSQHEVVVVSRADEALKLLEEQLFDAILCDVRMPGMSGVDLYEVLERRQPHHLRRMAFLTAGPTNPKEQRFLEGLTQPVLLKPFDIVKLRQVVEELALAQ